MTSPLRARLAALVVTACALLAGLVAGPGTASAEPVLAATTATTNTPVTVTFTFDDGLDQHVLAAQILESHGMRGVFFVNSGRLDTPGYLSTAQVVAMQSAGHEIGGHTVSHADLPTLDDAEVRRQVCNDRVALLAKGLAVTSFAYPYGDTNATVSSVVNECGYTAARDVGGLVSPGTCAGCDLAETIPPLDVWHVRSPDSVTASTSLEVLKGAVLQAQGSGSSGRVWVPFVMHHVCDGCDSLSISPALLDQFLSRIQAQAGNGVTVATMADVLPGPLKPAVSGPPPAPAPSPTNLLHNPDLEDLPAGSTTPTCWQHGGYGVNTPAWSVTTAAHFGGVAQAVDVTGFGSGDVRFISRWDLGSCAPGAYPGHTYQVTGWYQTDASVRFVAYYRTDTGGWTFLQQSSLLTPSSAWSPISATIGPLPANARAVSVGLSVRSNGHLATDDFVLSDADRTPPSVAMTSPTNNSLVRGAVSLAASVVDAGGIDHVDYLVEGRVVGSVRTAPYTLTWDTTSLPDETVGVAARAVDLAGNVATSTSLMVTLGNSVPVDTTPPAVQLTSPESGASVLGVLSLAADASDDDAVAFVSFRVNGIEVGASASAPFTAQWDTSALPDGDVTVTATAVDRSGNRAESPGVSVHLSNQGADATAPTSTMVCTPGCPTAWSATLVTVHLSATDVGSGVDRIIYTLDGSQPTLTNGATFTSDVSVTSPTTVRYRALDRAGNLEATHDASLLVDTQAPTGVAITSPLPGATVSGITPITTTSADNVGVVRVKFWIDGVQVGSRTTLPLQWNWDATAAGRGTHKLQVAALDAAGNYLKSTIVTVTVP